MSAWRGCLTQKRTAVSEDLDIRTWWVTRIVVDSISVFLFGLTVYLAQVSDPKSVAIMGTGALVIFVLLSASSHYRIRIKGETLEYWKLPSLLTDPEIIHRPLIQSVEHTHLPGGRQSSSVILHYENGRKIVMHLASFKPSQIRFVMSWLESKG